MKTAMAIMALVLGVCWMFVKSIEHYDNHKPKEQ